MSIRYISKKQSSGINLFYHILKRFIKMCLKKSFLIYNEILFRLIQNKKAGNKLAQFLQIFYSIFTWIHIAVLAIGCVFIYYHIFNKGKKS